MQQASSQLLQPRHLASSTKIETILTPHSIGFIVRGMGGFVKFFILSPEAVSEPEEF
jgi:hypothetical protein